MSNIGINDLFKSIGYMFQSIKGRFTIESYLELISEFTDETILQSKKEGLVYIGGECKIKFNEELKDKITVVIEMQFKTRSGEWKQKRAQREIDKNKFVSDAINQIKEKKELKYEISEPEN